VKEILITGGAGFVGFHLAKKLAKEGNNITIVDNFERPNDDAELAELLKLDNVAHLKLDLTLQSSYDSLPLDHYEDVYHMAAINGTGNFYKIPVKVLKVGVLSTIYLLDWIVKHKKKPHVIYTSSSETYAGTKTLLGSDFPIPTPEDVPLAVEDVSNVRWSYGSGKMIGEVAFYAYMKDYDFDNFKIVRLHNIYGPRMGSEHVIAQFIERFTSGQRPFDIYGSTNTRSFCYVEDALLGLQVVRDSGINGEIYHIGNDDEEIDIKNVAKKLFDLNGEEYNFNIHEAPEGSVMRRCPDVSKIRSIGYAKQFPLAKGLQATMEWYEE